MVIDLKINQKQLKKAVDEKIITNEQAVMIWQFLEKNNKDVPQLSSGHVLYYFGGLLSIGAVTLLIGLAWDVLKGLPLLVISIFLFLLGLRMTHIFNKKNLVIPAGIMAAFSLVLVPLITYNIQYILHIAPHQIINYVNFNYLIRAYWLPMEIATLIVGIVLFYIYRFNFILFPVSVILWYMSMDLYQMIFKLNVLIPLTASWFSLIFGLIELIAIICWDYMADIKSSDRLFWLYISATITFWGGLCAININYHYTGHFVFLLVNLLMLLTSIILQRKIFAICASIGIFWYFSDLAASSYILPFILICAGIIIIYLATKWSKVEAKFTARYNQYLPKRYRNSLTNNRL